MEDRGLVSTNRGIPVTTPEKSPSSPAVPILSYAELNANPHEVYQAFRSQYPYLRREDGAYIILRAKDVQAFLSDPRTRQVETEALAARGISSGPIMEFVSNSMLFSNGDAHRRRRHPPLRVGRSGRPDGQPGPLIALNGSQERGVPSEGADRPPTWTTTPVFLVPDGVSITEVLVWWSFPDHVTLEL